MYEFEIGVPPREEPTRTDLESDKLRGLNGAMSLPRAQTWKGEQELHPNNANSVTAGAYPLFVFVR